MASASPFRPVLLASVLLASHAAAQATATLVSVRDNTLYEDPAGLLSNGAGSGFFAGFNGSSQIRRGLVKFDVAAALPAGATVVSVELQLNCSNTGAGALAVSLHRALADWGEGTSVAGGQQGGGAAATTGDATWTFAFLNTTSWAVAGGDFAATASATASVAGVGPYAWASTASTVADVQSWLDAPAGNFGWLLKCPESAVGNSKRFDSREIANAALRPKLVVTYLPPVAASATSVGAGCGGPAGGVVLSASVPPALGAATFALEVSAAPPASAAFVFYAGSLAASPLFLSPGCAVYLDLASAAFDVAAGVSPAGPLATDALGAASLPLPIPFLPAIAGFSLTAQALVLDAASPLGFDLSNALVVVVGY